MATKIKRCLYVGLGGTGMNALLHTKKNIYGHIWRSTSYDWLLGNRHR